MKNMEPVAKFNYFFVLLPCNQHLKQMPQNVKIRCRNNGQVISVPFGTSLKELYDRCGIDLKYGAMCALVNNKVQGMNYRFYNSKDVQFLDITTTHGMRTYTLTLFLVLVKAVEDLYPGGQLIISAPVSRGYYCELRIGREVTDKDAGKRIGTHAA